MVRSGIVFPFLICARLTRKCSQYTYGNYTTLETIPLIRRIRCYSRSVVCERDQCMSSKRNVMEITFIQLAIDIDLPSRTTVLVQLRWVHQRRELLPPNLKEVSKGVYMACRSLNMYYTRFVVGV